MITISDLDILIDALSAWEYAPDSGAISKTLTSVFSSSPENLMDSFQIFSEESKRVALTKRDTAIMLKAKLVDLKHALETESVANLIEKSLSKT